MITRHDVQLVPLVNAIDGPVETGFAIRRFVEENANNESELLPLPEAVGNLDYFEQKMIQRNETARSREQSSDLSRASCRGVPRSIDPGDGSQNECLIKVYQELAENKRLLKQIQETIKSNRTNDEGHISGLLPHTHTLADESNSESETGCDGALTRYRSEIFSDCVSRFSEDEFYLAYEQWSALDHPSPAGYMELSSSFYPEQYTVDGLFNDPLFVISQVRSKTTSWTQEYFVLYAETPRRWRRLTVSATFEGLLDQASIFGADKLDDSEQSRMVLPKLVWEHVNGQLSHIGRTTSVTNISLTFRQNENGPVFNDHTRTRISEDRLEVSSGEDQILHDIEDLECEQFLESEVITQSRKSSFCFIVQVESRICIERKAPFVNSGTRGGNGFKNFFMDLTFLKSLRGCRGVAQFMGVVLDDARTHLKSYLYECPAFGDILTLLIAARSRSELIPWEIRECWARQIVETVAEIHRDKGALVGGLWWLAEIGIRANGTVMFTALRCSQRFFDGRPRMMAPELRGIPPSETWKMATFRTEIFQLGMLLWLLAEHRDNPTGCFCSKFACTSRPRYACTAEHADAIELPSCSAGIPPYFDEIIKQCRWPDPKDRKTASQLAKMFPPATDGDDILALDKIEIIKRYARPNIYLIYCEECGTRDMNVSYHCNQCEQGDFDLCEVCFGQGIVCLDPSHRLMKRIQTEQGTFKVVSE